MEKFLKKYFVIATLLFFTVNCNIKPEYTSIELDMRLSLFVENYKNERGAIILDNKYVLPSYCPLIGSGLKQINNLKYRQRLFKNDLSLPVPSLADVKLPFKLVKKADSATITLIKEEDTLEFRLVDF